VPAAILVHHCLYLCRFMEADVARKRVLVALTDTAGDWRGLQQLAALWACHAVPADDGDPPSGDDLGWDPAPTWAGVVEVVCKATGSAEV
jgi:hypothetical protein